MDDTDNANGENPYERDPDDPDTADEKRSRHTALRRRESCQRPTRLDRRGSAPARCGITPHRAGRPSPRRRACALDDQPTVLAGPDDSLHRSLAAMSKKTKKSKARTAPLQGEPRQAPEHGPRLTDSSVTVLGPVPPTRREDVVDALHGVAVADPYRWLEDGDAPRWPTGSAAQNARTRPPLDALPGRACWHERLVALMRAARRARRRPVRGDHLFAVERPAGAEQFVLTRRSATDPGVAARRAARPGAAAADAATPSTGSQPSPDGALVAVGTERGRHRALACCASSRAPTGRRPAPPTRRSPTPGPAAWPGSPTARGSPTPATPTATSTTARCTTTARHAVGRRPGGVGRAPRPAGVAGGRAVAATALAARPRRRRLGPHRRPPARPVDRRRGSTLVAGVEAPTELTFDADGDSARRGHRHSTRHAAASCACPRADVLAAGPAAWQTLVAEGDDVLGGWSAVGRDGLSWSPAAPPSTRSWTLDADGTLAAGGRPAVADLGGRRRAGADRRRRTPSSCVDSYAGADAPLAGAADDAGGPSAGPTSPTTVGARPAPSVVDAPAYPSLDGTEIGLFLIHRADVTPSPDTPAILNGYGGFAITESAGVVAHARGVVRGRRPVRHRRPARRSRGRRGVAPRRPAGQQAERVRRLPRRRRLARRRRASPAAIAWRSSAARTAACSSARP